ncbi:gephyrin-like molybdotransferase Glp [Polyangium sorediatum]|uniref:Molybdopterin molybdenumtransferase n=1 Tax=Polyangium sorediatum TaxID=889274 RepID=A0ABT6NV66_9BACT|nr:gephyrin-like molybdotransferase Glp [Polyangium sorediatum]MDI1432235.1 molybdopterin molybdotransferase MoeA [Polyangium sorediatum]
MLPYHDALARLLAAARPVGKERVSVDQSAGRVLAEDLVARAPMPAFDHSSMDGYAVRAADFEGAGPFEVPVVGESSAGGERPALAPKTACRIFTGARLPEGADAVIMQENVERRGDVIVMREAPRAGAWIRLRGSDLAEGAAAITRGTRMTPGHAALAAALDRPFVLVAQRPVVTILCSGDELRSPGEPGNPGSIAESNGVFVAAAARQIGAIARVGAYVPDDLDVARAAVVEALRGSDLVVTIGGVSVGDRDVMRPAFEAAGVTLDFWRVAIKPGKPIAVGRAGDTHVLGLPGNPASASLTWLLFGAPLVRALQGDPAPLPRRERVVVVGAYERTPGREEFVRARIEPGAGPTRARILPNQASGAVTSFAEAEVLVVVPASQGRVEEGSELDAIRIDAF